VAVSVYNTVYDEILDEQVVIPVFNSICPTGPPEGPPDSGGNCSDQWHEEDTVVVTGGASTDYFHIISFALFEAVCVSAGSHPGHGDTPCIMHDFLVSQGMADNVKTIEGCFIDGVDPALGSSGGVIDTGADVVYLKR
jgi:hypothetical protein